MPLYSHLQPSFLLSAIAIFPFFVSRSDALHYVGAVCGVGHAVVTGSRINQCAESASHAVGRRLPWRSSYWVARSTAWANAFTNIQSACCWYVDFFFVVHFFAATCANLYLFLFCPSFGCVCPLLAVCGVCPIWFLRCFVLDVWPHYAIFFFAAGPVSSRFRCLLVLMVRCAVAFDCCVFQIRCHRRCCWLLCYPIHCHRRHINGKITRTKIDQKSKNVFRAMDKA